MSASKNLGKVFMTPKGIWDKTLNYTKLDIVTNKVGKISCGYIATTDIEKNVEITDNRWLKLFELLDGDLTEEYKAVQMDVANKATDVDANKKAVDLIYSQMQKLYDVEISTTTPTNERTGLWINPDDISGVINIPEIKDDEVSDVDTWSSKKIDNVTASLKDDLANLENTLELPKDIYVLEPSDIQSGYIIDSNGTIRTNENCTLYKYDVTNINSVYISHRGAASMPVYWLEKNVLISHFTAEYDTWSGKVDTSNADTLYLNMISIYTPVVSCLVEGKRVPGYGKSYVDLQGKSSGHFYLINSESGCFSQQ